MPTVQQLDTTTGKDGRIKVRTGGADIQVGGILSWDQDKPVEVVDQLHFESPANANGVVYPENAFPTTGKWSFSFTGYVNLNTVAQTQTGNTGFGDGARVVMDFLQSKGSSLGYPSCKGIIKNYKDGAKMGNEIQTFSATLHGYGLPPVWGTVT